MPKWNKSDKENAVLITGGSRGLGLSFAKLLGEKGYKIILIARDETRLKDAQRELEDHGITSDVYLGDVRDADRMQQISKTLEEDHTMLSWLIVNAGIVHIQKIDDNHNNDRSRDILDTNLWGAIATTKAFLPLLGNGGRLLFVSSGAAFIGLPGYSAYCATKSGLIGFAASVRREVLKQGIRVHVACPGDIDTPQYGEEMEALKNIFPRANLEKRKPLSPETVASRIIKKCRGNRFFVIPHRGLYLLHIASKWLPRGVRDIILDRMFCP